MIKTHRLIVEQASGECSQVMAFQECAGVSDQPEASGMRFGESVKRKRCDGENNLFLRGLRNTIDVPSLSEGELRSLSFSIEIA